jgi:hypothetical protein
MIEQMTDRTHPAERIRIACLICLHTVICCVSLVYVADAAFQVSVDPGPFHIFYDPARLHIAIAAVAAFALLSVAFCFARFSFGYAVGFYFYTMISGYLWLNCFTDLNYDHKSSALSAAVSAVTFLLPALFIGSPIRQVYALSASAFDRLLTAILLLAAAAVISASRTSTISATGWSRLRSSIIRSRLPQARCCRLHSPALLFARLIGRRAPPCCCCC